MMAKEAIELTCRDIPVVLVAAILLSATSVACGCGCKEAWSPINALGHEASCRADVIDPGTVTYTGSTPLYRHHLAQFSKSAASDYDCHRRSDCSFEDVAEDLFICEWSWERQDETGWTWLTGMGSGCSNAQLELSTDLSVPGIYRAWCRVDDTPGDGPNGEDYPRSTEYHIDVTQQVIQDFEVSEGPVLVSHNAPYFPDAYAYHQTWSSTCGHVSHLSEVAWREYVFWTGSGEAEYTSGGYHHTSHDGANCFTFSNKDPFIKGGPGTDGEFADFYGPYDAETPYKTSACSCVQYYQYAVGLLAPPELDDEGAGWVTLMTNTLVRSVFEQYGNWYYQFERNGVQLPPRPLPLQ